MITSLLIANRGEIACRIIRTCRQMGIRSIAVYSDADRQARHVQLADEAIRIGPPAAIDSYLAIDNLLQAARRSDAAAIHPGYGFLAENAAFALACQEAGFIFIGPPAQAISLLGDKGAARRLAADQGLTVIPGTLDGGQSDAFLAEAAREVGFPLLVKAAAGGGGKGMRLVHDPESLPEALAAARREALHAFGSDDLLLEKVIPAARHVEIQVLGDKYGRLIHLGERECSIQRRYQKIIEESPSPAVSPLLREQMGQAALVVAGAVGYENAGTVEFLLDEDGRFYFLEMNTRLQVEHPVTEMVSGIDLVEWQIRVAEGEALPWDHEELLISGHAVEARVYAENPARDFLPATGEILCWREPQGPGVRVESGIQQGDQISAYYDPLLVKIITHGPDRQTAVRRLAGALSRTVILGVNNNLLFLSDLLAHPDFLSGAIHTRLVEDDLAGWQGPDPDFSLAYLVAALTQYCQQTPGGYWRNNPNSPERYRFGRPGQEEMVEVQMQPDQRSPGRFQMSVSTAPEKMLVIELDSCEPPEMVMTIDGYRQRVTAVSSGPNWWVQTRQGAAQFQAVPLLPRPHRPAGAGGSLRAPMPGSVVEILVEVGQRVEEGQALMKLEAMKMEHTIRSGAAGIIGAILFAPGDVVDADTLLIQIEEE